MNVREKIAADDYEAQMDFPERPERPSVLGKKVIDMTDDEAKSVDRVLGEYKAGMDVYHAARADHRRSEQEGIRRFQADLEKENDVVAHPKVQLLWDKVWERGHSSGLLEVVYHYEDLAELIQ